MTNKKVLSAGVQIVSKILEFPVPELYIIREVDLPNKEITGYYSFKNNEIIFNEDWVQRSEWFEVIITAIHEMRHAYQGYCIRTKSREALKTLETWEYEIDNYIMPSGKNNEVDDKEYLNQEMEIDAIAFTHWLVKKELKFKTVIPKVIKTKVENKISDFKYVI